MNSGEVKHRRECSLKRFVNNSEVRQCIQRSQRFPSLGCSQRFHVNSNEAKQYSELSQRLHINSNVVKQRSWHSRKYFLNY